MLESRLSHVTRRCLWEELDDGDDGKTMCVCADQHDYRPLNKTSNIFCSSDYFCKLFLLLIIFHFTGILRKTWFNDVIISLYFYSCYNSARFRQVRIQNSQILFTKTLDNISVCCLAG